MSVSHSAPLVPPPPGRAPPLPASFDSVVQMPVFPRLPGYLSPRRQLPRRGGSCHVVATSIHASTCHVDLSSTPGVCASTGSRNVEF